MNRTLPVLLAATLALSGCLAPFTDDSGRTVNNPPVFTDFQTARLHYLYLDPAIETLHLDVRYVAGREPHPTMLDALEDNLRTVAPHRLVTSSTTASGDVGDESPDRVWSRQEVATLVQAPFHDPSSPVFTLHVLVLNGRSDHGHEVAGYFEPEKNALVLFPDAVSVVNEGDAIVPYPYPEVVVRHVAVHELGHAVGLVDQGVPMRTPRLPSEEDDPCRCHSTQQDSPMKQRFGAANAVLDAAAGTEDLPYRFNEADLRDVRAFLRENAPAPP